MQTLSCVGQRISIITYIITAYLGKAEKHCKFNPAWLGAFSFISFGSLLKNFQFTRKFAPISRNASDFSAEPTIGRNCCRFFSSAPPKIIVNPQRLGVRGKVGYGPGEQEWGHINIRTGANMFYWLFYTQAPNTAPTDVPTVIWLQGGPGADSSGYGNFAEIGPLHINGSARSTSWVTIIAFFFCIKFHPHYTH